MPRPVQTQIGVVKLPTFLPAAPEQNPMFLEKRVYQGSSGRVYPLPFTDRISETPVDRAWKAVWIENEFLRVLVLPELGGRIHAMLDKTNGYDLIYRQEVIKPALVGLAGPWISGGIEFNWPQHHRPGTFLPVEFEIEEHPDGSKTLWCGDHDPMCRMKGMHGVCLHPGRAYVELKVRACNRTPFVQTFLWWANVATRVHEAYQSFFPPDVYCVADHARRSMSEYPLAQGYYYGINYGKRGRKGIPANEIPSQFVPPHCRERIEAGSRAAAAPPYAPNDLSFYANIPTPCSYMCMGSQEDFFGGYDYAARAGIVHIANHHLSPGKKQWTWGNHEFGYAWDRNLTERDANHEYGPYIELMAGVYTDNQPDFSFLQPGETKTWSQYWYPIQQIGPAQHANLEAAVSLRVSPAGDQPDRRTRASGKRNTRICGVGVSVTQAFSAATIQLLSGDRTIRSVKRDLAPDKPYVTEVPLPRGRSETELLLRVNAKDGREIISYQPKPRAKGKVPPPATEPPAPAEIAGNDELFITGLHLDQYRHATRCPTLYWREALRRDPLDARCNNAVGLWHLKRGEFETAERHFRAAIQRLTRRNPNPYDGEPFYNLGLTLRFLRRDEEAYAAFYKACWNQAWVSAGYHGLAEIDCGRHHWTTALAHLDQSLRSDTDNLRARNLKVIVLRKLGRETEAGALPNATLALDPLDWWARHLRGDKLTCDLQTHLDLAHDCARAGLLSEAVELLTRAVSPGVQNEGPPGAGNDPMALPDQNWGALPLVYYTLGWLEHQRGRDGIARKHFRKAAETTPDYCFPARLEEIEVLRCAMLANARDARAAYYLGNLLYDRRRHREAIALWERSAKLDPQCGVVWRNLGIGYFNILGEPAKARMAYDRALKAIPTDARLLYERDQLWKRMGETPKKRLRELTRRHDLVRQRDDLSVELSALYNQTGQHEKALALIESRHFQPWEGGEGGPLGQHVRSHLALGRRALAAGNVALAREHFEAALRAPLNLGEARHLLANPSDVHYWLGRALAESGDLKEARRHWRLAAGFKGDFQQMRVRPFSEMTFYSALSWERLGQRAKARKLLRALLAYARQLQNAEAKIDYFATSLPTMLLFEDDLQRRQETTALFLQAQAQLGLKNQPAAVRLLKAVRQRDPNHALAVDLLEELDGPHTRKRSGGAVTRRGAGWANGAYLRSQWD